MIDIPAAALEAGALALSRYSHGNGIEEAWEEDARGFELAITAALPHLGVLPVPADLAARANEILAWRRTGLLSGDALQRLADQRWPEDHAALQLAEQATTTEALRHLTGLQTVQTLDVEAMIAACIPGGDVADPQHIADRLRAWLSGPVQLPTGAGTAHG